MLFENKIKMLHGNIDVFNNISLCHVSEFVCEAGKFN
jgi:hypothetical protein